MLRTVSLKLSAPKKELSSLHSLREEYAMVCNLIVPEVVKNRCWNRVGLHKLVYNQVRENSTLGSQMACNAIFSVCKAYQAQNELGRIKKDNPLPIVQFKKKSVHFDKRTYSLTRAGTLSLYTLEGRIKVSFILGTHQKTLLEKGEGKEAELIFKRGNWYFNLVVEIPDVEKKEEGILIGVDVGENTIAATSTGKIYGGQKLREDRDRYFA